MTAFLAIVAGIFSGAPLLALRKGRGRIPFFAAIAVVGALLAALKATPLLLPLAVAGILVFLFAEFDHADFGVQVSAGLAVMITIVLSVIATGWYGYATGTSYQALSQSVVDTFLAAAQKIQPNLKVKAEDIRHQLPSGVVITYMVMMWFAILMEKSFRFWTGMKMNLRNPGELGRFRLPEMLVWPFIASFAVAFLTLPVPEIVQVIAVNTFNVLSFAYFLQGIAIVGWTFKTFRVGMIWRALFYFVFVSQLFLFVAFLGLTDLWVDFRARIGKKTKSTETV
jgi:hypothetical protein